MEKNKLPTKDIVVQRRYLDQALLTQMRLTFKIAFDRFRQSSKKGRGRRPFFSNEISPAILDHLDRIKYSDGASAELHDKLDAVFRNDKLITDFIGKNYTDRVVFTPLYPVVDAYLQIKSPGFGTIFRSKFSTHNAGTVMSGFLGEREYQINPYSRALKEKDLVGIYEYEDVDTHEASDGSKRILALIASAGQDFLSAVDIPVRATIGPLDRRNTSSDLLAGFCIPGNEFSPILMRTACFRFSNVGFLYTAGDLIDRKGQFLHSLTYEVLTNNRDDFGISYREKDDLVSQAIGIYFGPKVRRHLSSVTDAERYRKIREKIDKIQMDML